MKLGRASIALAFLLVGACIPVTEDNSGAPVPPHKAPGNGGSGGGHGGSGGSGGGAGGGGGGGTKTPPTGTGGGPTAMGCNGVTEKGRCELTDKGQTAVVCDVAADKLRSFDCTAMGKVCVLDSTRGATCVTLPPPPPRPTPDMAQQPPPHPVDMASTTPPPHPTDMATQHPADMAVPMCASGVDYHGYCAASTAIWCDPATGQTIVVNCAATGKTCQEDACAFGADCCDAPVAVDMAQAPSAECTALGLAGACTAGNHVRWCDGSTVFDQDCATLGETCQLDTCGQGAYCCAAMSMPDMTMPAASRRPTSVSRR